MFEIDAGPVCDANDVGHAQIKQSLYGPLTQVMNEIKVMLKAGFHPNLASLLGWYIDPTDDIICLVMGYCEGGTLSTLLKVGALLGALLVGTRQRTLVMGYCEGGTLSTLLKVGPFGALLVGTR